MAPGRAVEPQDGVDGRVRQAWGALHKVVILLNCKNQRHPEASP